MKEKSKMISSEKTNNEIEKWKPLIIDGVRFNYYISSYGRIFGTYRNKMVIPEVTKKGYLRFNIHWPNHKKHRKFFVHRLVGYLFVPGYSKELTINHKDGNHANNYYKNLEWVTIEENEEHASRNDFHPVAEDHPNSKYKIDVIRKACELLEKGCGCMEISRLLDIPPHVVYDIKSRKTWLSVSKDYVWAVPKNSLEWRYQKRILLLLKQGLTTAEILKVLGYKRSSKMRGLINKFRIQYDNDISLTFNDYPYSASESPIGVGLE